MEYIDLEPKPPEHIALSFSGGGYRAALFGLGCISYMDQLMLGDTRMTDMVNFVSSASGGTFTNLLWVVSQKKGIPFKSLYQQFCNGALSGDKVLSKAFEILRDRKTWQERPQKSRNLINAFSMAYDKLLFQGATFDVLYQNKGVAEVCVNATEFDNGLQFRFQNSATAGNKFLYFKSDAGSQDILRSLKLSDILAASSCFTVGFEPIEYPKDFLHGNLRMDDLQLAMKEDSRFSPAKGGEGDDDICFDLMDGGIDDNQGIASFMLAEDRLENKNYFGYDLYLACDVSSNYTSGYDFPTENTKSLLLKCSLSGYLIIVLLLFVLSLAGIISNTLPSLSYFILGVCAVFIIISGLLTWQVFNAKAASKKKKDTFGAAIFRYFGVFLKLRLSMVIQMLAARATSAGYLAGVVFLKKIRRISYDRLFEKVSETKYKSDDTPLKANDDQQLCAKIKLKHWSKFVIQNAIYLLSTKNESQRNQDLSREPWSKKPPILSADGEEKSLVDWMETLEKIRPIIDDATAMATTLWFDKNQMDANIPKSLLGAGQITTCYNLLKYVYRFPADEYWKPIQKKLFLDWVSFTRNPFWLHQVLDNDQSEK